jgi:environmental stress-induced protein Ves
MHALHLPAYEYRRMRWKNARGWTREILREPGDDDFDWRVSIAEIDQDGPFSPFPGCERRLVLLSGAGMRLRFEDGREEELHPPHQRIAFRGEEAPHCALFDGPTHDFNLIWRRDRVAAELFHRPLVGPMVFFAEPGVQWFVHLLAGRARLKDRADVAALDAADSLWLRAGGESGQRAILDGGGELLLVRIARIAPSITADD